MASVRVKHPGGDRQLDFLTGNYNANTGAMTLYVNGDEAGTATDATPIAAHGRVDCRQREDRTGPSRDGSTGSPATPRCTPASCPPRRSAS